MKTLIRIYPNNRHLVKTTDVKLNCASHRTLDIEKRLNDLGWNSGSYDAYEII